MRCLEHCRRRLNGSFCLECHPGESRGPYAPNRSLEVWNQQSMAPIASISRSPLMALELSLQEAVSAGRIMPESDMRTSPVSHIMAPWGTRIADRPPSAAYCSHASTSTVGIAARPRHSRARLIWRSPIVARPQQAATAASARPGSGIPGSSFAGITRSAGPLSSDRGGLDTEEMESIPAQLRQPCAPAVEEPAAGVEDGLPLIHSEGSRLVGGPSKVISVIDHRKGFGHTDLVKV